MRTSIHLKFILYLYAPILVLALGLFALGFGLARGQAVEEAQERLHADTRLQAMAASTLRESGKFQDADRLLQELERRGMHGASLVPRPAEGVTPDPQPRQRDGNALWTARAEVPGSPWLLQREQSAASALADFHAGARTTGLILGLGLAALLALVAYYASRLGRSLGDLEGAVRDIAQGNLDPALSPSGRDSFAGLARGILSMARRLEERDRALRRSRDDLERRVEERTAQLEHQVRETRRAQAALRVAKESAETANRAKSEFLSHMSHELRTPLNGVLGYAQLLRRDEDLSADQHDSLDAIESCGQHLLTLINDVLDLSKIEAGRLAAEPIPTALPALLKEVQDIVAPRAQAKGLLLQMQLDPALPERVITDPVRLRQILLNLMGNAVKFTIQGQVRISVQALPQGRMGFEVADTGVGIPVSQQQAIFEAFHQTENGVSQGGTGLGLAINQRLVELLDGTPIEVQSSPGQGASFRFSLPLQPATGAEPGPAPDERLQLRTTEEAPLVLVVDDHPDNRDILQRLLRDAGCRVATASDGVEGVKKAAELHPALVMMDIRMPGMDGLEMIGRIRADETLRHLRVVAVTASVLPEYREQALAAGFDDFVSKPYRVNDLLQVVARRLGLTLESATPQPAETTDRMPPLTEIQRQYISHALREACDSGDLGELDRLYNELRAEPQVPEELADEISRLSRRLDIPGLRQLAERLAGPD